jgi:hypothetical protein
MIEIIIIYFSGYAASFILLRILIGSMFGWDKRDTLWALKMAMLSWICFVSVLTVHILESFKK